MFLEKCRLQFPELRAVSVDNLMYIKEDLIIPHVRLCCDLCPLSDSDSFAMVSTTLSVRAPSLLFVRVEIATELTPPLSRTQTTLS
jgi:hypothetical protein